MIEEPRGRLGDIVRHRLPGRGSRKGCRDRGRVINLYSHTYFDITSHQITRVLKASVSWYTPVDQWGRCGVGIYGYDRDNLEVIETREQVRARQEEEERAC